MQFLLTESLFFFAGGDPSASTAEAKEQVDARSVYVGNVRFYKLSFSLSSGCMRLCFDAYLHEYVFLLLNFYIVFYVILKIEEKIWMSVL